MGASGRDPASATRALFTYQPHRDAEADAYHWMPPAGYQFPVHYELKIPQDQHDVAVNQAIVDQVQADISDNPKYWGKYVIPLRRGVFNFLPEESASSDYPLIDRRVDSRSYRRAA